MLADKPRSSSFQRNYYQVDAPFALRGTRRKKRNKSALSATVSTVNQANEEETQEGKNNNTLSDVASSLLKTHTPAVKPISSFVTKKENGVNGKSAQEVVVGSDNKKNSAKKGDSGKKENTDPSYKSRFQYHASFVLKRPTTSKKSKGAILEPTRILDLEYNNEQPCASFSLRNKPNQQDPQCYCYYYQEESKNDTEQSHESAPDHQCLFDPVMTWFKEPSGAEDPHVNNKGCSPTFFVSRYKRYCAALNH